MTNPTLNVRDYPLARLVERRNGDFCNHSDLMSSVEALQNFPDDATAELVSEDIRTFNAHFAIKDGNGNNLGFVMGIASFPHIMRRELELRARSGEVSEADQGIPQRFILYDSAMADIDEKLYQEPKEFAQYRRSLGTALLRLNLIPIGDSIEEGPEKLADALLAMHNLLHVAVDQGLAADLDDFGAKLLLFYMFAFVRPVPDSISQLYTFFGRSL